MKVTFNGFISFLVLMALVSWALIGLHSQIQNKVLEAYVDYVGMSDYLYETSDGEVTDITLSSASHFLARCDGVLLGDPVELEHALIGTNHIYLQEASCSILTFEKGAPSVRASAELQITDQYTTDIVIIFWMILVDLFLVFGWICFFSVLFE